MAEPLLIIHHSNDEVQIIPPVRARDFLYACGDTLEPRYPVPATIGFVPSRYGTYLIDTRKRVDGMPLFRGYNWEEWTK